MITSACIFRFQKHLPEFPDYVIDTTGALINLKKGKEIAPNYTGTGCRYKSVRACRPGVHRRFLAHRLVLESFRRHEYFPGAVCDHKDNDPGNNSLNNLHWVTQSQNVQRAYDQGRAKSPKAMTGKFGKAHPMSKPIAGYDSAGIEVISFESVALARKAGYHPKLKGNSISRGLHFKYV